MPDNQLDDSIASHQPSATRIDIKDAAALRHWAVKLDTTPEQLKDAVTAVGDLASDVELHLKGSRSSINSERVHNAL